MLQFCPEALTDPAVLQLSEHYKIARKRRIMHDKIPTNNRIRDVQISMIKLAAAPRGLPAKEAAAARVTLPYEINMKIISLLYTPAKLISIFGPKRKYNKYSDFLNWETGNVDTSISAEQLKDLLYVLSISDFLCNEIEDIIKFNNVEIFKLCRERMPKINTDKCFRRAIWSHSANIVKFLLSEGYLVNHETLILAYTSTGVNLPIVKLVTEAYERQNNCKIADRLSPEDISDIQNSYFIFCNRRLFEYCDAKIGFGYDTINMVSSVIVIPSILLKIVERNNRLELKDFIVIYRTLYNRINVGTIPKHCNNCHETNRHMIGYSDMVRLVKYVHNRDKDLLVHFAEYDDVVFFKRIFKRCETTKSGLKKLAFTCVKNHAGNVLNFLLPLIDNIIIAPNMVTETTPEVYKLVRKYIRFSQKTKTTKYYNHTVQRPRNHLRPIYDEFHKTQPIDTYLTTYKFYYHETFIMFIQDFFPDVFTGKKPAAIQLKHGPSTYPIIKAMAKLGYVKINFLNSYELIKEYNAEFGDVTHIFTYSEIKPIIESIIRANDIELLDVLYKYNPQLFAQQIDTKKINCGLYEPKDMDGVNELHSYLTICAQSREMLLWLYRHNYIELLVIDQCVDVDKQTVLDILINEGYKCINMLPEILINLDVEDLKKLEQLPGVLFTLCDLSIVFHMELEKLKWIKESKKINFKAGASRLANYTYIYRGRETKEELWEYSKLAKISIGSKYRFTEGEFKLIDNYNRINKRHRQ